MTPVSHHLTISEDTVDEELKAVMKALHPQWSDEVLEQHIKGLHSAKWTEAYRDIFREPEAKSTSLKKGKRQASGRIKKTLAAAQRPKPAGACQQL